MNHLTTISVILLLCLTLPGIARGKIAHCNSKQDITLQVLGSGGPIADDDRASTAYLERLLGSNKAAYEYLAGYLDGSDELVRLDSINIDPGQQDPTRVYSDPASDIKIFALGVPHGPVPALAYRLRKGQKDLVFSGDQNGSSETFTRFAKSVDVLIMHMPVPESISDIGRKLHAPPSIIGNIAAETETGQLVLSHFMARSLDKMEDNLKQVRNHDQGPILLANDLDCIGI